jgi:hypothetical protein
MSRRVDHVCSLKPATCRSTRRAAYDLTGKGDHPGAGGAWHDAAVTRATRCAVAVLVAAAVVGCGEGGPRIVRTTDPPASSTTTTPTIPAPRPTPTSPVPVAEPAELDFGRIDFARPSTAVVTVRPARQPVRFGRTELRGGPAYDLTADTCSGVRLLPESDGCRLEVTVLSRATGEVAARLVLPYDAGTLTVPVSATVPLSYAVSVTVLGAGTVTGDQVGLSCSSSCTARIPHGSTLTLTGSTPARWGGACAAAGTAPVCRVAVATPLEITADFR